MSVHLSKVQVYQLDDSELVMALRRFAKSTAAERLLRNRWEREFTGGIAEQYIENGCLTWKQRRQARLIVLRLVEESARRVIIEQDSVAPVAPSASAGPVAPVAPHCRTVCSVVDHGSCICICPHCKP